MGRVFKIEGSAVRLLPEPCSCGLPWKLCTAISMIATMCDAATRGEVWLAATNGRSALEVLEVLDELEGSEGESGG